MSHLNFAGESVAPGETKLINLSIAKLYDSTEMKIPIKVIRGKEKGPILFVSGVIHGDEINGVEIVRRVLRQRILSRLKGTLIAVPIVNVFGFNTQSRYLPDRRDLNRCFPGTPTGSLASRLAHIFMTEIVDKSTHGIDLHTASIHRKNMPQIRACLDHKKTEAFARAFGAPVILNSSIKDGSLRQAALEKNIPMLVFEGGEALRFDHRVIQAGVDGVLSAMKAIGMLDEPGDSSLDEKQTYVANSSFWIRAPQSGILRRKISLGQPVKQNEVLGIISGPLGENAIHIKAPHEGLLIGNSVLPLVNRGDGIFHLATFDRLSEMVESVELYGEDLIDVPPR